MFVNPRRKRRQRRRLVIVGICFIVLGMAMYGYNASREQVRQQQQEQQAEVVNTQTPIQTWATPNVPAIKPQDPVIEEHAEVILITHYLGCGHEVERTLTSENYVGLTQKQIQALYPQYTILSFDSTHVELKREVEGVCPQHYMVKLEGSNLVIYQRTEDDSWRKVQTIEDFTMPYPDQALTEGVIFDDMHQIERYLENFDS